ncbi:unnamed protein product, partial [Prorocentrum cordatum]
ALLDSCMQQATVALAETSRVQLASCQQQLVGMFQAQQEHAAKSLAVHARDVAKVGEHADALADEQRRMRAQIDDIEKMLAMAAKEVPIIDFQALEAWARLPDARIFSVGAPELVGPAQVRAGIHDWLTAAGLDNNMVRLDSSVPRKRFNIVVEGGLDIAIPRAQRARDIITSQGVKLAELEMGDRRETDATIRWNMDMVLRLAIDRGATAEQFKKAFSLEDRTEVHGSEDALKVFCQLQPQRYLSFLAAGSSPGVGGVAYLVPQQPAASSTGVAPAFAFDIVIPGRVALLCGGDPSSQYSIKIMGVRSFDLSDGDFAAVEAAWNDAVARAADGRLMRILTGAGGFNIARYQLRQPAWRRVFAATLEIEAPRPARFDRASQQLSVIGRVFLGIDAHAMLSVSTRLTTACGAMELSERGLSDRAPLVLQIEMARRVPREEQVIPSHLFSRSRCPETFSLMMANGDLEAASVEDRWRATMTCMTLAAGRIRDEQVRAGVSLKVKGDNAETTRMGLKTAARALWRQDASLAARLLALCPDLAARLLIDQGDVRVADAGAFADALDAVAAKAHAMRRRAAEAAARRPSDRDAPAWRRVERRSAQHAQLWIPWRRRVVLAGLRLDSPPCASDSASDVTPEVVSDPAGMTGVVAEYWGKIFERAPTVEQMLRLNQFLDRFAPQLPVAELPQPSLRALERAAERAPPSAPGPGQLPCAAWRRSPGALLHLRALMEQLFNEGVGAPPWRRSASPMLLSFDFEQAFPSLFRDVIDIVLPRSGVPLGFCFAISALCCNCLAISSFRVSGGSAAMEPLFALRCGIVQGCPLSGTVWCSGMDAPIRALIKALGGPPEGCLTACADDLGMLIRNAKVPPSIADSFVDVGVAFNLQLAIQMCALVPLWAEVTPDLINDAEAFLAETAPSWRGFRVASSAMHLGSRIGPGIAEQGTWKDAAAKWRSRATELSRAGMAGSLAARACNVKVLLCLSYLAQVFFIVPEIWRVEFTMLHRLLRFPPSAMRKADILSLGAWRGPPAPMGLLPCSIGALLRAAARAVRNRGPTLHALHDAAVENLPLASALKGSWKIKRHAVAMRAARDGLYEERFGRLIGRRLRRRGMEVPDEELRGRWLELRAVLRAARPAWMRSRLRAISNGWIASGRMHVMAPRLRTMGCESRDDLSHYIVRPVLRGEVAALAQESELSSGATFFGL